MMLRPARVVALFVVVAVITSAVQICLPRAAAGKAADGQMACGQENGGENLPLSDLHLSGVLQPCCTSVDPLVLTKSQSLSAPVRDVLYWMTPAALAATSINPAAYLTAIASSPPSDSIVGGTPPRYVVHKAFLI